MRPHRMQLHSEPLITTGKLETPGARGREPEGEPIKAHTNVYVCVSPTILTGGYRLLGAINGAQMSLLLDTGAAVTLLREDTWARAAAKHTQELQPRSTLKLVSAGGTPLTIHGCTCVELELEGGEEIHDRSRSDEPVNLGGHPWSRFSQVTQGKDRLGKQAAPPDRLYPTSM